MDPRLIWTTAASVVVEIALPFLVAFWLIRRFRVSWKFFVYGALVFFLSEGVTRLPAIIILQNNIQGTLALSEWYMYAFIAFAALTAGLFEEGGRYLGYRFLWKNEKKTWARALLYGTGHGGLESAGLVGISAMLVLFQMIALSQIDVSILSADQAAQVQQALTAYGAAPWWSGLAGGIERIMAMVIQIALAVLVLQVFTRGQFRWWWLALGYHFLVDLVPTTISQYTQYSLSTGLHILLVEGTILPFALLSAWIIYRLRPEKPEEEEPAEASSEVRSEDTETPAL